MSPGITQSVSLPRENERYCEERMPVLEWEAFIERHQDHTS